MARISKEEKARRDAAKKRVEELLGDDVTVDIKKVTEVADKLEQLGTSSSSSSGNAWLEKQVEELSSKNVELEDQLVQAKSDYQKLLNSGTASLPVNEVELQTKIRAMFNDLRNNYEGNNATRTKYTEAKIRVMLEKFLLSFEFLRKK